MKLIIDGYNLIKKIVKMQHISLDVRHLFLKRLSDYAKKKRLQILIVFDGGDVSFNYCETVYGIEVIYSGFLETADDVIMRFIDGYNSQEELVVVSSDRQIVDLATSCRIDILKSEEFYNLLQASELGLQVLKLSLSGHINKITNSSDPLLDELMELSSRQVSLKDEPDGNMTRIKTKKLSKNELQKQRKLKKL